MTVVIHHNPGCGTSRNVLKIIQAAGYEPTVIEYLETGWTRPQLLALFAAADLGPRDALRTTKSPAEELGLLDPDVSDETLIASMLEHPVLVNRPIVCTPIGDCGPISPRPVLKCHTAACPAPNWARLPQPSAGNRPAWPWRPRHTGAPSSPS